MSNSPRPPAQPGVLQRLDRYLSVNRDVALFAPLLVYLILLSAMSFREQIGEQWVWVLNIIRGVGGLAAVWLVRKHLPPWGKPHVLLAIVAGVACAALWVIVHKAALAAGIPHPMFPALFGRGKPAEEIDPFRVLGHGWVVWATISTKILVAVTTVAFCEELFWRGFLLRALIDRDIERVPLGAFTWKSFLICSLLSTLEHPGHWVTSITCWFAFNGLFYWKKSLLFLVLVHGFTNLALYVYVVTYGDWGFW